MERLDLFNFKSYEGLHSVPFTAFTAGQSKSTQTQKQTQRPPSAPLGLLSTASRTV